MNSLRTIFIAIVIASIGLTGCAKKITKIEPLPEPPKPAVVAPEPTPAPVVEQFVPVDLDAQLREILQTVYFDFDKYDLRPDAITSLGRIAGFIQEHKTVRLLAEGHCDERGSSEYNMGLGENRAKAVKKYLVSYGIAADRIETTSYGKERLAQMNCGTDDYCGQKNRRVEWKALAK